jgi:hypothetical protein
LYREEKLQMNRYFSMVAVLATLLVVAACGGGDDGGSSGTDGDDASGSAERVHSKVIYSDFIKDEAAAMKQYAGKYWTIEAFVAKHTSDDDGAIIRLKAAPFATNFIHCYYDPAQQTDIPELNVEDVVFMTGNVDKFLGPSLPLNVLDCSIADVDLKGGGMGASGGHDDQILKGEEGR